MTSPLLTTRRGFLRDLTGGSFALAVAARLPVDDTRYPAQAQQPVALTAKEHAVVRAIAEAILVDVPVSPELVAGVVDRELALIGEPILADMKAVLGLIEHLTFLDGRVRRFTALPVDARLRYLEGWGTSRFNLRRGAYHAVRTLVHFFAYAEDSTRALTGYEGAWPERLEAPAYPVDYGEVA